MIFEISQQRHPYAGDPLRAWVRIRILTPNGATQDVDLIADTGSPFGIVIGQSLLQQSRFLGTEQVPTNFGMLESGWVLISIPEIGLQEFVLGYSNDEVVAAASASDPRFAGLIGLPVLRLAEYGGDDSSFWLREKA